MRGTVNPFSFEFVGSSPSTPTIGDVAQLVEHCTEDAGVSSSNLFITTNDFVAQSVELFTFNEEVIGSSPIGITIRRIA